MITLQHDHRSHMPTDGRGAVSTARQLPRADPVTHTVPKWRTRCAKTDWLQPSSLHSRSSQTPPAKIAPSNAGWSTVEMSRRMTDAPDLPLFSDPSIEK